MEFLLPTQCAGCGRLHAGRLCSGCRPGTPHRPPISIAGLHGCITLAPYDAPLGRAVRTCKRRRDRRLAVLLGDLLADRLMPARFDAIVPAPTPWQRRWSRGFHLAAVLAAAVGARWVTPVQCALRARMGPRQARLTSGSARRQNVRGRIRSCRPAAGRVLLIDDVITTGTTAQACVRELLGDATDEVWLATLCAVRRHTDTPGQDL